MDETQSHMKQILKPIVLCNEERNNCNYLCLKFDSHSRHDCLGSHRCDEKCKYCVRDSGNDYGSILTCGLVSVHSGSIHECKSKHHKCGKHCQVTQQCGKLQLAFVQVHSHDHVYVIKKFMIVLKNVTIVFLRKKL